MEGPSLCSGVWGELLGRGTGGSYGGVSKVLQVTVQVKRQILSAVWRKALEVPTVQRERSSLTGTQVRALWKKTLLRLDDYSALPMSEHSLAWWRTPTNNETHNEWYSEGPGDTLVAFFLFFFLALLSHPCSNGRALLTDGIKRDTAAERMETFLWDLLNEGSLYTRTPGVRYANLVVVIWS